MTTYTYLVELVSVGPGGIVRAAPFQIVTATDPATGLLPANLRQAGQSVSQLVADDKGVLNFTTTAAPVDLSAVALGYSRRVEPRETVGVGGTGAAATGGSSKTVVLTAPTVVSYVIWQATKAGTVTGVRGYRNGGTGATINAQKNALDLLAADLSLATADTWLSGPSVQNASFAAGDLLRVAVRSVAGSPAYVTIQVDYTEA